MTHVVGAQMRFAYFFKDVFNIVNNQSQFDFNRGKNWHW